MSIVQSPAVSTIPLGRKAVLAYASGSFGTGVFSTVPTVLLLYYATEIVGVAPAWAALVLFAPKAWAIVWDPIVGAWSDRTVGRFGRRRPFLAAGAAGVTAAFIALFSPPSLPLPASTAWLGFTYLLLATLYSLFAVPYTALPAEIGTNAASRSALISARMVMVMLGILAGAALAPMLVEWTGGGRSGYAAMAVVLGLACGLAMTAPLLMLKSFDRPRSRDDWPRAALLRDQARLALSDSRFRLLAGSFLLQLTAVGAVSASTPYIVTRVLGRSEGDVGLALGAYIIATVITVPFWAWFGRRVGETRALGLGAVLYAAASTGLGLSGALRLEWPVALAAFALAGVPFAALQVLPFTALADLVHARSAEGGSAEGVYTGLWTATEKLGLAIGPALVALALAWGGGDTAAVIPAFVGFVPAALAVAALIPLQHLRSAR